MLKLSKQLVWTPCSTSDAVATGWSRQGLLLSPRLQTSLTAQWRRRVTWRVGERWRCWRTETGSSRTGRRGDTYMTSTLGGGEGVLQKEMKCIMEVGWILWILYCCSCSNADKGDGEVQKSKNFVDIIWVSPQGGIYFSGIGHQNSLIFVGRWWRRKCSSGIWNPEWNERLSHSEDVQV